MGQFMVLVNPALINMGTTGYGLAGRRIRDEIISRFQTTYYLRTLPWGAVTKCVFEILQGPAHDGAPFRETKNQVCREPNLFNCFCRFFVECEAYSWLHVFS